MYQNQESDAETSSTYPQTIRVFYKLLEAIGHTNKVRFNSKWLNKLKCSYFIFFHSIIIISLLSHLISTFTRSIRYLPEFFHAFCEDLVFNIFYFDCNLFLFNYNELQAMVRFMETSFCVANEGVVQKCSRRGKATLITFLIIGAVAVSGSILETISPVSEKEVELIRFIYQRKHPERRLQTNFYVPCIDDSESWYFEAIYTTQLYLIALMIIAVAIATSLIPTLVIHIEGQYSILCDYVAMIGRVHIDHNGKRIIYTDIMKNEVIRVGLQKKCPKESNFKLDQKKEELYQQDYCRQIVKFHQMLIRFQEQVCILLLSLYFFLPCIKKKK